MTASDTAEINENTNSVSANSSMPRWIKVCDKADWQERDSSGEVTYRGRMWLFGGWFNSYEAPPRDVWSSSDGRNWDLVTNDAPWIHSDLPMTLTFQDKMWFMGGWYNGRLEGCESSNQVWCSTDGAHWEQATANAAWTPRLAAGIVEFKGRMWILGGIENYYFGDESNLKNDVWSSADGKVWELATADAGWAPRAYHQAAVLNDKIYIFGGGNYVPEYRAFNDVWCSEDGVNWTQLTENAPWEPRLWFSTAVYRDHLWIIGGWANNPAHNIGDVWYSRDGKEWTQLPNIDGWKERHEHSVWVHQDKLWLGAGHAMPLSNEVWSLELPANWKG